jgi:hypothetical protein
MAIDRKTSGESRDIRVTVTTVVMSRVEIEEEDDEDHAASGAPVPGATYVPVTAGSAAAGAGSGDGKEPMGEVAKLIALNEVDDDLQHAHAPGVARAARFMERALCDDCCLCTKHAKELRTLYFSCIATLLRQEPLSTVASYLTAAPVENAAERLLSDADGCNDCAVCDRCNPLYMARVEKHMGGRARGCKAKGACECDPAECTARCKCVCPLQPNYRACGKLRRGRPPGASSASAAAASEQWAGERDAARTRLGGGRYERSGRGSGARAGASAMTLHDIALLHRRLKFRQWPASALYYLRRPRPC